MFKKTENVNLKKTVKVSEKKGESRETSEKPQSESSPQQKNSSLLLGASDDINFTLLEERRKSLSEEHEKLLASNRVLQEEVLRLKSKIDKCVPQLENEMEDLKRKVKDLVAEDRHPQVDKVFTDWIAGLKVHKIPSREAPEVRGQEGPEEVPLKLQIEDLKRQIGSFKEKMKAYKESKNASTESALANVKEEIGRVREGISKLRVKFSSPEKRDVASENAELIRKLDEVKEFLEKLK